MKICAVIAEFNPFHNGHKRLIDEIRKKGFTHIVAIMSGNFVQRGEPSIISKSAKVHSALLNGIDIVVEIPVVWALSSAEKYASAGIQIAKSLGCVDAVAFGSECGSIDALKKISSVLKSEEFELLLKKNLDLGISFPKARELAVSDLISDKNTANYLQFSNNILGVEYIKAAENLNFKADIFTIKRNKTLNYRSASEIRKMIMDNSNEFKKYVPHSSFEIVSRETINKTAPYVLDNAEQSMIYKLRISSKEDILSLPDVNEGLENRILNAAKSCNSLNELLFSIKTKRYTMSRIKRILMCNFLRIDRNIQNSFVPYIRLLGTNSKGLEIMKSVKKFASLPIVSKYSHVTKLSKIAQKVFECECLSSDLYSLFSKKINTCGKEQSFKIITHFEDENFT